MGKQVVIFCASSKTIDPKYNEAARALVRGLHGLGYDIVSGGGAVGTMGAITDESVKVGGRHVAVLPRFMQGLENPALKEVVWTDRMSSRKDRMREGACAAIALPGGIGTMDELMETHTLRKLNIFTGEVHVLNLDGFYEPLKRLLDQFVQTQMLTRADADLLIFSDSVEELLERFKQLGH